MSVDNNKFLQLIRGCINNDLPGVEAQKAMAPVGREYVPNVNIEPRNSAVLILLLFCENSIKTVLIERAKYNGYHSGQIAFPGGKSEKTDNDIVDTAIREANEEIGIDKEKVTVLGKLTPLYIPVSNINVYPVVAYADWSVSEAIPNYEVQSVEEVDLLELCKPENIQTHIFYDQDIKVEAPCFKVNNITVWGATAMILSELKEIVARCGIAN